MFCTECGANLDNAIKFCSQCGAKVKQADKSGIDHEEAAADEKPVEKETSGSVHLPVTIEETMEVRSAAISSNGEFLAVRMPNERNDGLPDDGLPKPYDKLEVLKTKSMEVLYSITLDGYEHPAISSGNINAVCSNGEYISMVSGGKLAVLDIKTGKVMVKPEKNTVSIRSIFSPNSNYLAVAYREHPVDKITIYNVQEGKESFTLTGHKNEIIDLAYSPDGNYLVSVDKDETICLWVTNGEGKDFAWHYVMERDPAAISSYRYSSVVFSPDGKRFAISSKKGDIVVRDTKSGSLLLQFLSEKKLNAISEKLFTHNEISISFAPDGKSIIAGFYDGTIIIYNAETGEVLKKLSGSNNQIIWTAYSSDSKKFIYFYSTSGYGSSGGVVKYWVCE